MPENVVGEYMVRLDVRTKAVRWDGGNLAQLQKLVDLPCDINPVGERGFLLLTEPGREPRVIEPGMWLRRSAAGTLFTASNDAFRDTFTEADD